jgi:hypothetical protein
LDFGKIKKNKPSFKRHCSSRNNDISLSEMYFNNLKSYLEETPSVEIQTAITDVEVLYLTKEQAEKLRYENHAFCYIYIYAKSWEKTHLEREKRSYLLQKKMPSNVLNYLCKPIKMQTDTCKKFLKTWSQTTSI